MLMKSDPFSEISTMTAVNKKVLCNSSLTQESVGSMAVHTFNFLEHTLELIFHAVLLIDPILRIYVKFSIYLEYQSSLYQVKNAN